MLQHARCDYLGMFGLANKFLNIELWIVQYRVCFLSWGRETYGQHQFELLFGALRRKEIKPSIACHAGPLQHPVATRGARPKPL